MKETAKQVLTHLKHGDFAKIAGITGYSPSTVQKYFRNDVSISEEAEAKILEAATTVISDETERLREIQRRAAEICERAENFKNTVTQSIEALS